MSEPLVSVKMITYNHAPFIAQAIEGVLQQKTNFPFELVIGEDCSTDGTREIVFEYQRKYPDIIRVITSDENVGMKKNGYRTTKACRGKYIAYCEGDDYWHRTDKMQIQAEYLESHPDCGLVYTSYDVYHPSEKKHIKDYISHRNLLIPEDPSLTDIVENKGGWMFGLLTCTVMLRRALLEKIVEADPYIHKSEYFLMGDTQVWAEMATLAKLHFMPESMATHIITDESATRSKDIKKVLRFGISSAELGLYLCKKYNLPVNIRVQYESYWCDRALRLALYLRNPDLADEVKTKKKTFGWKDWIRYYGAKNKAVHYIYIMAASFKNFFIYNQSWR